MPVRKQFEGFINPNRHKLMIEARPLKPEEFKQERDKLKSNIQSDTTNKLTPAQIEALKRRRTIQPKGTSRYINLQAIKDRLFKS